MNKIPIYAFLTLLAITPLGVSVAKDAGSYRDATPGQQDDARITAAVNTKLTADEGLRGRAIAVQTENGIVSLGGFVRSEAEKKSAVALASSVDSVTSVNSNLKVDPTDSADSSSVSTPASNSANTQDSSAFNTVPSDSVNIQNRNPVNTQNRAPIPTAVETTENAVEKAGTAVEKTAEELGENVVDATITTEIKAKYVADPGVKASNIDVDTKDNSVTLTGTVSSRSERDRAIRIARTVKGVKVVHSHLIIKTR